MSPLSHAFLNAEREKKMLCSGVVNPRTSSSENAARLTLAKIRFSHEEQRNEKIEGN